MGFTGDLARRYQRLPGEVRPPDGKLKLTADREVMQRAIRDARSSESAWPEFQYLWELPPAVLWARDPSSRPTRSLTSTFPLPTTRSQMEDYFRISPRNVNGNSSCAPSG